ncbi:hypothetical protein YC2023_041490 [Brassica napus]
MLEMMLKRKMNYYYLLKIKPSKYATVAEAASNGQCNIRRCRSCHLQAMIAAMNSVPLPVEDA